MMLGAKNIKQEWEQKCYNVGFIKCTNLKISLQLGLKEHQITYNLSKVKRTQTLPLPTFLH